MADFGIDGSTISIQAYLDTGASCVLLSRDTAEAMQVSKLYSGGNPVVYQDVTGNGVVPFDVSQQLYVSVAPFHPDVNLEAPSGYTQSFGPVRTQINQQYALSPSLALDVVGMPAMAGKVVVMDARPVDNAIAFLQNPSWENLNLDMQIHTFLVNPGTPFNPSNQLAPGIPTTNHHVALSYGDFSRFTEIVPGGAEGPTLYKNPIIGPNPVAKIDNTLPPDNTPGITVSLGGLSSTGSFLFDTGAAASMISTHVAADLHVRYREGTFGTSSSLLETFDPAHPASPGSLMPNQFQLTLSGLGPDVKTAGFFLDSLLLPTVEGNPGNAADPNNIRFLAPPYWCWT